MDEFALGFHLAKPRRGTAGFFERHGGDPVVHELQAKRVELPRAEVRHTAVTLLGHAVQQHRAVRVARGDYARVVETEVALRRLKIDELGSLERQVVVQVEHRGAAAALMVAVGAVRVEIRTGAIGQRRTGILRVGQSLADWL